jgi:hypothetical protein
MRSSPPAAGRAPRTAEDTSRLALRLTMLALEIDQVALELAGEHDLDTETLVPGAMRLLSGAVDQLERRLTIGEFLSRSRRAEWLDATREVAGRGSEAHSR